MLMTACSVKALCLPEGSHNGPRLKAEGHYGCLKVNNFTKPGLANIDCASPAI